MAAGWWAAGGLALSPLLALGLIFIWLEVIAEDRRYFPYPGTMGIWAATAGAVLGASRWRGTSNLGNDIGLRRPATHDVKPALAALAACVAVSAVVYLSAYGHLDFDANPGVLRYLDFNDSKMAIAVMIGVTCIGTPIVEEMFFRGLLQGALAARMAAPTAILVQATIFGALHTDLTFGRSGVTALALAAAHGMIFGLTRWWTGRLVPSIAVHAAINFHAVAVTLAGS